MAGVSLRKIWKRFGTTEVIRGVDLDIEDGEFVVLVGPSGCGKSTLLNLVAGLEGLSSGDIFIGAERVNDVPPRDRNIAMVFQSYALYPTKSVHRNMTFGLETRRVPHEEQERVVKEFAELLHIDHLLERKPGQLSGGQRQRVAMGRALVRQPEVFLFDEPLSNLDAKLRIEMRTEIRRLHKQFGKTTIYVTHDQIEAMTLASRIAVMDNGTIRQVGTPDEIYEAPVDLFVASFMGSPPMNIIKATISPEEPVAAVVRDIQGEVRFQLPEDLAGRVTDYRGREVYLGLRPEIITHPGGHSQQAMLCSFERIVDVVEPTGPDIMFVFLLGGTEAIARVRPEARVAEGSPFCFEVDMRKAKLFDPTTGKRL
ncbi:sn-glycerol-3-phosphate import ATP-binding protein ugpC [Pseudorhizobium banfieldiae]|uniref:sn-glycerol-3-phosphate import ATP-binding protein ugpC n=1 Tax=Pseudorhizobium banfieldiae TaxID=1125847 RepID=L0NKI1_9HYPH|nr:sn-glycerol-3-phosphate ABC transporter ATP-binding protein UgpC [Pseudorhizobium banfieldiae]CAD6617564.1 sn-glycerol-3-phosphate ABC transporter ATP-binding protein UgpC [arsenite-oxidising bacterium NT-25]CCF20802.1 sn-glycerol-3-phosphate import ATP-binding protein ugpC [Pseudorhizobium banfieldiae]